MYKGKENHKRFLNHLDKSTDAVFAVAKWLNSKGIPCTINPMQTPEDYEDKAKDSGDIWIQQKVEVKKVSASFTSGEDWPFKDFIICASHSFDDAFPKPYKYIILNNDMTYAGLVDVKTTKQKWYKESRTDSRYLDYTQEFYFCPIHLVEFTKL